MVAVSPFLALPLVACCSLAVRGSGRARCRDRARPGTATLLGPLSVLKRGDLDFGMLAVTGAGTAVIDPSSGRARPRPAGDRAGGNRRSSRDLHCDRIAEQRSSTSAFRKSPITVTRVGGTETMTVSNWTLDGKPTARCHADQTFDFAVGATLTSPPNQAEGTYVGTFDVTVQYP